MIKISKYTKILFWVGIIDLATTVFGLKIGYIQEGNPLMNWFLMSWGIPMLIAVKIINMIVCLGFLEWARTRITIKKMVFYYRSAIFLYCACYIVLFVKLNFY
jgi:hypothetical protein